MTERTDAGSRSSIVINLLAVVVAAIAAGAAVRACSIQLEQAAIINDEIEFIGERSGNHLLITQIGGLDANIKEVEITPVFVGVGSDKPFVEGQPRTFVLHNFYSKDEGSYVIDEILGRLCTGQEIIECKGSDFFTLRMTFNLHGESREIHFLQGPGRLKEANSVE